MRYVVILNVKTSFGIMRPFLGKVFSYKKGEKGILLTFNLSKAHKYISEKNAQKPAQLFNGEVKPI